MIKDFHNKIDLKINLKNLSYLKHFHTHIIYCVCVYSIFLLNILNRNVHYRYIHLQYMINISRVQ